MGSDQIATIRPIIAELEDASGNGSGQIYCAAFDVPGRDAAWVEVVAGEVNVAYPFTDDPMQRLDELALGHTFAIELSEWQPGTFAAFTYDPAATTRELARFVDSLFERLLLCGGDYPLDVWIGPLANRESTGKCE
jgi:hypothetical protein